MLTRLTSVKNKIMRDDMTSHGLVMVTFGLLAGLFNYLYQLSMGILLSPAEFGTLFSLFSLFRIISWFPQSLELPITKFVSTFKAQGRLSRANYLWKFSLKRTLLIGLAVFVALTLATPLISKLLNIDNNLYPIILFSSFILAFSLSVNYGTLGGLQRFLPLGFSNALLAFLRLSIAVSLVYLGLGVYGGLAPVVLAYGITFLVTIYFLKELTTVGKEKVRLGSLRSYTGFALLALICFAVVTNIDVVLAKHYLSVENAGDYAAISVLGRAALFAPAGIVIAMFPKTSELFETGGSHHLLLRKAMLYALLLGGGVVIIFLLFPEFVANFVLRGKYPVAIPCLFRYGLAMLFFALSFLMISYFLSLNQTKKVAYCLLGLTALQLGLISFFHSSIAQLVNIMLIMGALCLALMLPLYLKVRSEYSYTPNG